MIQGKFYQRLHFYTDSCAISPMASLLHGSIEKNYHERRMILSVTRFKICQGGGSAHELFTGCELFTKINHKPINFHYKFNIFSIIFVTLFPVICNVIHL